MHVVQYKFYWLSTHPRSTCVYLSESKAVVVFCPILSVCFSPTNAALESVDSRLLRPFMILSSRICQYIHCPGGSFYSAAQQKLDISLSLSDTMIPNSFLTSDPSCPEKGSPDHGLDSMNIDDPMITAQPVASSSLVAAAAASSFAHCFRPHVVSPCSPAEATTTKDRKRAWSSHCNSNDFQHDRYNQPYQQQQRDTTTMPNNFASPNSSFFAVVAGRTNHESSTFERPSKRQAFS